MLSLLPSESIEWALTGELSVLLLVRLLLLHSHVLLLVALVVSLVLSPVLVEWVATSKVLLSTELLTVSLVLLSVAAHSSVVHATILILLISSVAWCLLHLLCGESHVGNKLGLLCRVHLLLLLGRAKWIGAGQG